MNLRRTAVFVLGGLALVALAAGCGGSGGTADSATVLTTLVGLDAPSSTAGPASGGVATDTASNGVPDDEPTSGDRPRFSDLPAISVEELPDEAYEILVLIDEGGPFRFDKDGSTFQNRERLLPQHERGHYREYTVLTPGDDDRGPRRIVAGADGERYWTDDHYDSFSEIVDWEGR